ncbi:MAG: DUF1501 domain-containing protein [Alphaproteobacteria bacterium]
MPSRREILALTAAVTGGALLRPLAVLADAATDKRFVLIILRGGLDGLAAVPPYGDREYRSLRGALALPEPGTENGILDIDGRFGVHPALKTFHAMMKNGEALAVHAVATPYRERSHFDAQDLLENGTERARAAADGWLNRALALMGGSRRLGLAVGQAIPLALRGTVPVASWVPTEGPSLDPDFVTRIQALYRRDPLIGAAFAEGIKAHEFSAAALGADDSMAPGGRKVRGPGAFKPLAEAAGRLLAAEDGPRIAVLELSGWDTHSQQGGRLPAVLGALDAGLAGLAQTLGPAWSKTVVVAVTEFGRTAAPNGTGGTDHGTAGVALMAGGAVAGGRVVADWPGLSAGALYQGRDLAPTTDLRSVLKGVLRAHLSLRDDALSQRVFPGSAEAKPADGIIRT